MKTAETKTHRAPAQARAAEYDEAAFCAACLDAETKVAVYARRYGMHWTTPEDLVMDFIEKMLRLGWWRRFDPARASLRQFVDYFMMVFLLDARCRRPLRHVRDSARAWERAKLQAANPQSFHEAEVDSRGDAARAVLERIHRRVPPETSAVLDLLLGSGGSPEEAVLDHPLEMREVRDELRTARRAAKEAGLSWRSAKT